MHVHFPGLAHLGRLSSGGHALVPDAWSLDLRGDAAPVAP
jgi:hypothetical protein